ncbi:MAG: energy-coupling factor transporter transmembrane protein EcfT [Oscillospiraceae bacterium]|nr:energy-coupling factor transporter transmembrane protein EcfT [Oscillospiraceae bacterium]MCD8343119.1 energy-coupling factor transporter transmembrane protein EcfT [Oscillospiraceae bacterium]
MLKDITLGQYFPGDTIVHRLDARTKIICLIAYIAALFTAKTWLGYALALAALVTVSALSRIKPAALLRGLKPLWFIVIFTGAVNALYGTGEPLAEFWIFKITESGILQGIRMMLRIMLLVCGTFLLTYTTSPLNLTDAIESLLSPLKRLHAPVHEVAMMMSIALRFIPTLIEETDRIISAQKARGAAFDTGKLTERARALLPLLVPLFVSAFRRADELATAMECRCYHGGEGRTRMKTPHLAPRDGWAMALGALLVLAAAALRRAGI